MYERRMLFTISVASVKYARRRALTISRTNGINAVHNILMGMPSLPLLSSLSFPIFPFLFSYLLLFLTEVVGGDDGGLAAGGGDPIWVRADPLVGFREASAI